VGEWSTKNKKKSHRKEVRFGGHTEPVSRVNDSERERERWGRDWQRGERRGEASAIW
jgi:hypothetical protein